MTARAPWWDRLNRALFPYIGPPPLGPYGEAPLPPTGKKACPICGQLMEAHTFERSQDHAATRMYCPDKRAVLIPGSTPAPVITPAAGE